MNGKEWKPTHTAEMFRLHGLGCTDGVIARETGHCLNTVGDRRRAAGLSPNHPTLYAPWEALPALSRRAIREACANVQPSGGE